MIQGKRRILTWDDFDLDPGEYGKGPDGRWYCCPPGHPDLLGGLGSHQVVEHEDGTVTVSPSILIQYREKDEVREAWHGWLERGMWREA